MNVKIDSSFFAPPPGALDSLYTSAARFTAARPNIAPGALMRRFSIARTRAGLLLEDMRHARVVLGYPVRGVYRVNRLAWRALQEGAA